MEKIIAYLLLRQYLGNNLVTGGYSYSVDNTGDLVAHRIDGHRMSDIDHKLSVRYVESLDCYYTEDCDLHRMLGKHMNGYVNGIYVKEVSQHGDYTVFALGISSNSAFCVYCIYNDYKHEILCDVKESVFVHKALESVCRVEKDRALEDAIDDCTSGEIATLLKFYIPNELEQFTKQLHEISRNREDA